MPALALRNMASAAGDSVCWMVAAITIAMSVITAVFYWNDKRRAGKQSARIPEATLHLAELLGGWPGAFAAQRVLRHKTAKVSYQIIFWLIVLLHQVAAFEIMTDMHATRKLMRALGLGM